MPPTVRKNKPGGESNTSAPSGVLSRIKPLGFDGDEGIQVLLYGKSGTGKTTLWSSFPGPILAVIVSGGKRPGELRSIDTPEMRKKVHTVTLESSEEMRQIIEHAKGGDYGTVVLDHATGLADLVLKEILGIDELPAQKGWGMASQQQYGQQALQCKEVLRGLLGLSCNVVVVAHERTFNDDSSSDVITPTVGAALSPSLTGWLNGAVDYIVSTCLRQKTQVTKTVIGEQTIETVTPVKGVEYCLRVGPDPVYMTKFRRPLGAKPLPDVIVNPTYPKLLKLTKGE